jgi:hypothetical protein
VLAQAPLLQLVCRTALRAGIKLVNQEVHGFLAAAVQVRWPQFAAAPRQGFQPRLGFPPRARF